MTATITYTGGRTLPADTDGYLRQLNGGSGNSGRVPGVYGGEAQRLCPEEGSAMATGDEAEFRLFVASQWTRLVRTACLLTGDRQEAEDAVQSTLAKVYVRWRRSGLDSLDAYVYRSLLNTIRSWSRRRRLVGRLTAQVPDLPAPDRTGQVEQRSVLLDALAGLPARQRAVLVLRYWEDLSEFDTARILDISVGTVKSQAAKGLAKLRECPELMAVTPSGVRGRGIDES
jgi:RNA polymerase sigma-70 factor (sigma-E family)